MIHTHGQATTAVTTVPWPIFSPPTTETETARRWQGIQPESAQRNRRSQMTNNGAGGRLRRDSSSLGDAIHHRREIRSTSWLLQGRKKSRWHQEFRCKLIAQALAKPVLGFTTGPMPGLRGEHVVPEFVRDRKALEGLDRRWPTLPPHDHNLPTTTALYERSSSAAICLGDPKTHTKLTAERNEIDRKRLLRGQLVRYLDEPRAVPRERRAVAFGLEPMKELTDGAPPTYSILGCSRFNAGSTTSWPNHGESSSRTIVSAMRRTASTG
jgi:hypothetical protein